MFVLQGYLIFCQDFTQDIGYLCRLVVSVFISSVRSAERDVVRKLPGVMMAFTERARLQDAAVVYELASYLPDVYRATFGGGFSSGYVHCSSGDCL